MKHNTPHHAYLLELAEQIEKRDYAARTNTSRAFMLLKDLRIAKLASDMLDAMAKDPDMREAATILRWKFNTPQAFGHGRG